MPNGWHRKNPNSPAEQQRRRDYNSAAHRAARAAGTRAVAAGTATCWRCHKPIPPGTPWHVGHDDHRRIRGPEHATCNTHAAAIAGARARNRLTAPHTRWHSHTWPH